MEDPFKKTPEQELEHVRALQERELEWWKGRESMESIEDIQKAIEEGWAVRVPSEGEGYKISEHAPEELNVLEKGTSVFMEEVVKAWLKRVRELYPQSNDFLVISSLGRTIEHQEKLEKETDNPAVEGEKSTHTRLGAFDIGTKWFRENHPELLKELTTILNDLAADDRINFIPESEVHHVAYNPEHSVNIRNKAKSVLQEKLNISDLELLEDRMDRISNFTDQLKDHFRDYNDRYFYHMLIGGSVEGCTVEEDFPDKYSVADFIENRL